MPPEDEVPNEGAHFKVGVQVCHGYSAHPKAVVQGLDSFCELLITLGSQRLEEGPLELADEELHKQLDLAAMRTAS